MRSFLSLLISLNDGKKWEEQQWTTKKASGNLQAGGSLAAAALGSRQGGTLAPGGSGRWQVAVVGHGDKSVKVYSAFASKWTKATCEW